MPDIMGDPLALELEAIKRGISKAELMRQQSLAPRRIDSPTQGLAQLAQAFVARKKGQEAEGKLAEFEASVPAKLKEREKKEIAKKTESSTRKADLLISQGRLDPANKENFIAANNAGETGLVKPGASGFEAFGKAFADSLSKGDRSKINKEFLTTGKSTKKSLTSFDKMLDSIETNPESVTLGGTAAEAIEGINANLKGLGKTLGFDPELIDASIDSIGGDAVNSAAARANIKKIVRDYARAKGESGKALSDKDLADFTQQITARWGNPNAIKAVLLERRNELVDEFELDKSVNRQAGFNIPDIKEFQFTKREAATEPQQPKAGWKIIE